MNVLDPSPHFEGGETTVLTKHGQIDFIAFQKLEAPLETWVVEVEVSTGHWAHVEFSGKSPRQDAADYLTYIDTEMHKPPDPKLLPPPDPVNA